MALCVVMATPTSRTPHPAEGAVPGRPYANPDEEWVAHGPPGEQCRRPAAKRPVHERMLRRRWRSAVLALLLVAAGLVGLGLARNGRPQILPQASVAAATATGSLPGIAFAAQPTTPAATASVAASPTVTATTVAYPVTGPGAFRYAAGWGPVLGTAGTLRRFRIAIEDGMGQDVGAFAAAVDRVLGDPRSWIASRQLRLQRVPESTSAEFTIYLATPGTSEKMCATGGLRTERFTSCRLPGQVIINVARWREAIPDYGAPLADYQAYALNHEVGHQLGYGHEACPGWGRAAPVMQQQTYGLKGCVAYAWPYLDGHRYTGALVP